MVNERLFSRLKALKIYTLRVLFNSRTNAPFISGDGIANLCEVSMYSPMWWKAKPSRFDVTIARSVFVPGHKLDEFLVTFQDELKAKVLVVGNSDRDYLSLNLPVPKSVKLLLLQNSHISQGSIATLPIGIENLRYGRNGFKRFFKYKQTPKINKILFGPYSNTHSEREEINSSSALDNPKITVLKSYVSPKQLASIARHYAYIACPRGNGTDTHRFWESLYRGSIPIVKKSAWSESLKPYHLPFIEVDSWEIDDVVKEVENNKGMIPFDPEEIPCLWLPYWQHLIELNSK